jgi:hypothetical protein
MLANPSCTFLPVAPSRGIQLVYITVALLACMLAIMAYGTFRCRSAAFEDPMTESLIEGEPWNRFLDGWGILHFWFFAVLAFYFPGCWLELVIAGIVWEGMEMMFKERPFYLAECTASTKKNWWYGRWEDIVMNTLGLLCGLWVAHFQLPGQVIFSSALVAILGGFFALQQHRRK